MSSVRLLGLPSHDKVRAAGRSEVPEKPVLVPYAPDGDGPLFGRSTRPKTGLNLLHFSGSSQITIAPHIFLEHEFIQGLSEAKDPDAKAGLAEMLGRARSMNALSHLTALLNEKEPVQVRIAAIKSLGRIGNTTDKNSFTRNTLSEQLLTYYNEQKAKAEERFGDPMPFTLYEKKKEQERREQLIEELKALAVVLSELGATQGRTTLQDDYRKSLALTEQSVNIAQEMQRAIQLAEETLKEALQKQYKKPIKQILKELDPDELRQMKKQIKISFGDGEEISLLDAMKGLRQLESQQQFASRMLIGLMDSLARQDNEEAKAALKLGLNSSHPGVKAKALRLLAKRGGVSYNSDIYPNLKAADTTVRSAAMEALLHSGELPAKQKVLELMAPAAFFQAAGTGLSMDALGQYTEFLAKIAENGDEYVQALTKTAVNSDYDVETRQIALLVLNMMTDGPTAKKVSPSTVKQAQMVIRAIARDPIARTPDEQDALALLATQLWVTQKDPQGIVDAILLADSGYRQVSTEDQEALLGSVLSVLLEDVDRNGKNRNAELQHRILSALKKAKSPLMTADTEKQLREAIGPKPGKTLIDPKDTPDVFSRKTRNRKLNRSLLEQLKPAVEPLRPTMESLLENDKSLPTQMIISRIIGLFRDKDMVDTLIDKVRDPLKGQVDWEKERSYRGNPSVDGANVRLNALIALGDIGDARALKVMLDAMDDPVLQDYVIEPLGNLAKSANQEADKASLAQARQKLMKVIANPDVSRAHRATRIKAASALFQFDGGVDALKKFVAETSNPNFKRHVLSALVANNYALEPDHPDHALVKPLLEPELGVSRLHAQGLTGKGVEMAVVDGGYVDKTNKEAFQNRVKLPAEAESPEHYHPTMVMSTAAANGKIKGVAPDAVVYSDKWPEFDSEEPMEVYKKIIEGKLRGENNIRVINNSWGFSNQNVIVFKEIRDILKQFKQVVDLAEKAGIQIVFAAGNDGENPGVPKLGTLSLFGMDVDKLTVEEKQDLDYILDKVILVGAVNTEGTEDKKQHKMAEFSSVGDSLNAKLLPTVVAPGVDMMVYGWDEANSYPKELVNGTSFASPYVSAVIGLMTQANPKITPAQIRDILKSTAVKLDDVPVSVQGRHGEINPEAAVEAAKALTKRKKAAETQTKATLPAPPAETPAKEPAPPAKKDGDTAA